MKIATFWFMAMGIVLPAAAGAQTFNSSAGKLKVTTVVSGLENPWAVAFLPSGRMLITERPGRLRIAAADGKLSPPLDGLPEVYHVEQGGLLDVVLDRNFTRNRTSYFCFAEPVEGGGRTALARAALRGERLEEVKIIYRQEGPPSQGLHFGCRIVQGKDDLLFLTQGEHGNGPETQNLNNHLGKIIRIAPDGSVPKDNPFVGRDDTRPEIWSYGHRNSQGAVIHPVTGKLWVNEHGPQGGDEINIAEAGKNYGWPVVGYGIDYSGAKIHESTSNPDMVQPIKYWVPSIAPSGMTFYNGSMFRAWKGNLFLGALAGQMLVRLKLEGEKIVAEERLLTGLNERIRDVRTGPDGALYLVVDSSEGRVLRVTPAS